MATRQVPSVGRIGWAMQTAVKRHLPASVQRWLYWRAMNREWRRLVAEVRKQRAKETR